MEGKSWMGGVRVEIEEEEAEGLREFKTFNSVKIRVLRGKKEPFDF
jgi:hypothetical protein